jgi:hypothetical protein
MKPLHYAFFACAVVFLVLGMFVHRELWPCPDPISIGPTKEEIARQSTRDSIDVASAIRKHIQDSLAAITPEQRNENALNIARSLHRAAQRDSMLTKPS